MVDPVELTDLTKSFGARTAVDGLTLRVRAGEIYGLLGPNGAGKTTALRMVVGLVQPTRGHARIAGVLVAAEPERARRSIGFLSGSTGLYERLTGRETLAFFAALHGMDDEAYVKRTELIAERLDLRQLLDRRCGTLSTGERQRVSLGRALLPDPAVLILDEPTSGLDVLASRFLRDMVEDERRRGKAVIFSTHYLAEAELLCTRVGLLHQGRLVREGAPAELRAEVQAASLEEAFLAFVGARTGVGPQGRADEGALEERPAP
jgi:sodium transport system ATP-binding protein